MCGIHTSKYTEIAVLLYKHIVLSRCKAHMDGPKSNENDFFAQRSRARKG